MAKLTRAEKEAVVVARYERRERVFTWLLWIIAALFAWEALTRPLSLSEWVSAAVLLGIVWVIRATARMASRSHIH